MKRRAAVLIVAMAGVMSGAGCGGKAPAEPIIGPAYGVGIGDCIEPTTAGTRAWANGVDGGRVTFCRDAEDECRVVELATGAMAPFFLKHDARRLEQPGASVDGDDGTLSVCWGPLKCLTRAPAGYEHWLDVKLEGASRAAALAATEGAGRKVYVLDADLTTTLAFDVADRADELVWKDGRFLVLVTEGPAIRGHLYAADGAQRGQVGAVDGAEPLDLGERSWPVAMTGPGPAMRWAFLAEDATVLAVHDLDGGGAARIDLGIPGQPSASAGLAAFGDDGVAVVLGGARYGDVVVVDVATRAVEIRPATRCAAEDAP